MYRAAIIGGTGYGGAELCRQLLQHPDIELLRVSAIDHVGQRLGEVHLNLEGHTDLVFEDVPAREVASGVDVVLLGLPHTVSSTIVGEIADLDVRIIDLSGDFRLRDVAVYNAHYHTEHPHPELIEQFVYGLPELNRDRIKEARWVASPGCFATCITLGLLPLARAGLLQGPVRTVACTGSSGSGAYAKPSTHHPIRVNNLKAYKILRHQHRPEIEQSFRDAGAGPGARLDFVPISAPLARGILATSLIDVPADTDEADLAERYRETFRDHPFVKVVSHRTPEVVAVAGTNYAEVGFQLGPRDGDVRPLVALCAVDNLIKGGAGQAVQSLNLCLGLPETSGLIGTMGIWP